MTIQQWVATGEGLNKPDQGVVNRLIAVGVVLTENIPDDAGANAPEGKTNSQLRNPTAAAGIYAGWDAAIWDFGGPAQYPILKSGELSAAAQRR